MKLKQFIFAFVAVLLCSVSSTFAQVAKIGETDYATLSAAAGAVKNGETIVLTANCSGSFTIKQVEGKSFTIHGNGKTFSGTITINGNGRSNGDETLTFTNVVFDAANSIIGSSNAHNVIFDTCTFKTSSGYHISPGPNYNWKFLNCKVTGTGALWQAASATSNLYVEGFVSENSGNVFKIDYCSPSGVTATFKNVEIKSGVVGFYISNRNSGSIIFENVTANCQYPIYVWDRGTGIDTPLAFDGKNEFASTAGQPWLTNGSAATIDAAAHIVTEKGLKVYGSLADAAEDAKLGETIVLLKNTDETVELPAGVTLDNNGHTADNVVVRVVTGSGTWGGIDWTLYEDGELVIAPTAGEPVPDKNAPTKRTYEVGEWREAVVYKSNGSASAIGGYPYDVKKVKSLVIEEGVTKIGSFTAQFPNLTGEVVLPKSLTYIGQEAFSPGEKNTTQNITKVTFAAGGTEPLCIANGAFKYVEIEEIAFPGDRESIDIHHWAFGWNYNLKSAYIPANVVKSWGGEHVDYFDNFNSQSNVTWAEYGSIFTGCPAMEIITFENEEVRDRFFANNRQSTVDDYIVACVGTTAYNSFADAIKAANEGDEVLLVNGNRAATATVVVDKAVTINGNGRTYKVAADVSPAFKLEKEGAVVKGFANSVVVESAAPVVMLGDDAYYPTITAAASAANDGDVLTLSAGEYSEDININKNITLKGVMNEAAPVALDDTESQNSGMTVYTGTMTIGEAADVTIQNIDFVGKLVLANGATVKAAEGLTVTTNVEGYEVAYENGAYSVVEKKNDVAKIGETGYASLAAAFAAANVEGNHTITLLADNAEVFEFAQVAGANITVDGEGKTFTGKITLNAGAGSLTFTDMTLTPSNADAKSIVLNAATAPNVTIDGCTMKNTGTKGAIVWGQASTTNNKVVIKNSTASNLQYLVGTNQSGCEDVTVENVTATDMAYLIRPMKATKVTVKDVTYSGLTFIHVKNSKESVLALENVEVTTNGYLPIAMMTPDSGTDAAMYTITLNGENTANGAAMTKANEAAWFERQDESNPYEIKDLNPKVAKIGEQGYETLQAAINAATAGQTITFVADITENVTVDKALTIDGAKYTYTGAMTLKADATIKNLNFDGNGYNGYAITTRGAQYLTIEDCTAKNYGYGFVQLASATDITTVKNVTVSNMSFGVKVDYSNAVVLENVDITASSAAVLNSNYGEKTITIKNSKLNILGTWDRETAIKTNYVFEGANTVGEFKTEAAIDNFKLADGATLTAPNDIHVTTDVEGYEVVYADGAYSVVEQKNYVAKIGETGYETFVDAYVAANDGDTIELLADVTVPTVTDAKINWNYDTAMFEIRKVITIDGNGHKMTADAATATNKKHTLHIQSNGAVLKDVIIDNVGKTKNVNVYCAQNVIFDNVQIINANAGYAALTVNGSTVTTKTAFKALGNAVAIDLDLGSGVTTDLGLIVEEGTVFDLNNKTVKFNSKADVSTAGNAVDANGNPYFAAYDTSKLYTVAQLKSKAGSLLSSTFSNGLTFVADAALDFNLKVKGTLDLNGHHITIADSKQLTAGGNLTINGNGKLGVKTIDKGWYTITIEDGAYGIDVTQYCRQGYASLPDLNGYYVVGAKPTAQVNDLGGQVIAEKDYMVYGGSKSGDMPLSFVMQFLANQTAEDMETSPYADWFADFVITFEGLEDDFVADGCYLAGYYGEFGWVKVPVDGMTVKNGERYPVMLGVDMGQKYDYICSDVKDFRCAMFLTPEVLAANPNISVKLELAVVDNSKASEGALEALVNNEKIYVVGEYTYTAENFKSPVVNEGTWGGIDWTLRYDGSLTIAPTKGTPTTDNSGKWTYEVGQWPEAVRYNSNGGAAEIALWPYDLLAVKSLVIEEGVTSIGSFAARGFKNLTGEVVIPSTVTYIGQEAFQFSTMTKVTFAEGGTEEPLCIAQGAFKNTIIEEIALPADRPSIHLHAWVFQNCHYLKNVTLPANVTGVTGTNHVDYNHNPNALTGGNARSSAIFADCERMETITFGSEEVKNLYYSNEISRVPIVATVGLTSYSNLATAIEVVNENGGTITMNKNATLADTWTIPADKEVTLDLNGYTVSAALNGETTNHIYAIHNYGTLTIKGNAKGAGAIKARGMYNYGTLTLESGTIDAIDGNGGYGVYNQNGSVFVMNGGTVKTSNEDGDAPTEGTDATPMRNENGSKVVINGGTITNVSNYTYAIDNQAGAEVTINGATVTSVHSTLSNYGTMTINDGTFTCNGLDGISAHALVAWDGSETTINGGTFDGKDNNNGFNVYAAAGAEVEIKGGRFENAYSGSLYGDGNIVVSGGTFFDMIDQKWCAEGYVCKESESVEGYYDVVFDPTYGKVAMIGDTYYETLAAAIAAAKANDVITFIADIEENVELTKNVTINGAEFAYTGKMTITSNKGAVTIKNVNFDGKGYNGYAVETRGVYYLTVEDCTAKNYGYGFVQNASSTVLTTVKNVTVSDMRYGVKVDYATAVVLENVDITATSAAVLNSNYGEKTITIKNSKLNILATWKRNGTTKTTYVFEGENTVGEFMTEAGLDNFKLAAGATLTAPEGLTVTTDVEHYIVDYTNGVYRAIPDPMYIAELTLVDGEFTDYAPYAGLTVGEFTYQRKFSTTWAPFYVPFNVPVSQLAEQGLEIAYINGVRRDDTNYDGELDDFVMEVIYIHGGSANGSNKTLKANYPYFVRTKSGTVSATIKLEGVTLLNEGEKSYNCTTFTEEFFIKGVNMTRNLNDFASNDYVVTKDDETGEATWSNTNLRGSLRPFRFYMTVTSRENGSPVVINQSMAIAVRGEELPDGTTLIYDVEVEAAEDMIFDLQGRRVLETEKGRIYIKGGKKFIAQ